MYRIVSFIVRYREFLAASLLTILSFVLISSSNNERTRSFRTISVGIVAAVQSAFDWIPNPWALQSENDALRRLNRDLTLQGMRLRDAGVKVDRLQDLLEFTRRSSLDLISAEVVGKPTIQLRNYITINRGSADSVEMHMPVITNHGLVGRVVGLNESYSIVQLITNADSRVAARMLRGRETGIITWGKEEELLMQNIRSTTPIDVGDTILTSGLSAFYPPDIPIGYVRSVEEEQGTLYHRIVVEPAVNFGTLEEVFVVQHVPSAERLDLESEFLQEIGSEIGDED